jgi:molybdopterin-guanine dinucleotide biosynthesis protein A
MGTQGPSRLAVWGLVLSGGQGRRMGGQDKGLMTLNGEALALRAARRLQPQVDAVCISANRNLSRYRSWGYEVWPDSPIPPGPGGGPGGRTGMGPAPSPAGQTGPLAGLFTALAHLGPQPGLLAVAPCDYPFLPEDWVATLAQALSGASDSHSLALAITPERPHWCIQLIKLSHQAALMQHIEQAVKADGGRVGAFAQRGHALQVTWPCSPAWSNANRPEHLAALGTNGEASSA